MEFTGTLERPKTARRQGTGGRPTWSDLRPDDATARDTAEQTATAPILEARDVTKVYDLGRATVEALRGVTLSVAPGEFVALMGPSGSGKSTLLQLLGGLDRPTSGSIVFEGRDISALTDAQATRLRRERTGYVFQAFNLIPLLDVTENVMLPFTIAGSTRDARERVRRVIELVELTGKERHRPDQLSAGEQQRGPRARDPPVRAPCGRADRQP